MRLGVVGFLIALLALAGCSSSEKPYGEVQKEQARKHWAAARASVLNSLARDQYQAGQFDKCRSTINDALKLDANNPELHLLLAKLSIEQGNLEVAEQELATVRKLAADNAEADYLSGVVAQRWQKLQTAYDYYLSAAGKQPAELAYLLAQAEMLVALGRTDEALGVLRARVVYFEHSATIRDAVGQLLMQKTRFAEAVDYFRQASSLASDDTAIREHLALSQIRAGQHREASETLSRLLKSETYAKRADLYLALGECHMQLGQPRDAREALEIATQTSPNLSAAWLALGKASLEVGDVRRSEMALKRALSIEPQNAEGNLLMGYNRLKQNRMEDALVSFRKASVLAETDPVSQCMVGYVLEKLGRTEEALKAYAKALKLKPGDELATKLLAELQLNP